MLGLNLDTDDVAAERDDFHRDSFDLLKKVLQKLLEAHSDLQAQGSAAAAGRRLMPKILTLVSSDLSSFTQTFSKHHLDVHCQTDIGLEPVCSTAGHGGYPDPVIFNELCALKDEPGPCKAIKDRYFFNVNSGSCELFEYGGCGGNANNFETFEECEKACVVSDDKNPCHLPEAPGPCRGLVKRFFFDSEIQQCKHFYYGGCFGNANNFRSMDQCQRRCQNQDELTAATEVHVMSVRKPIMVQPTITTEELTVSEPQVQLNVSNQQQN
ncbi:hypothetical protein AMECASPLE_009599, partial [Ameca splendens]